VSPVESATVTRGNCFWWAEVRHCLERPHVSFHHTQAEAIRAVEEYLRRIGQLDWAEASGMSEDFIPEPVERTIPIEPKAPPYSINERAERLMGRRLPDDRPVMAFDLPCELGYWCPTCRRRMDEALSGRSTTAYLVRAVRLRLAIGPLRGPSAREGS
jgi:hypothetical protein